MSSYIPNKNESLDFLTPLIEQAIDQDTNDFNQLSETLGLDPKTDFAEGDLSQFDLKNSSLVGANFECTRFDQANLCGANLRGANLRGANLSNADLSNADLSNADLRGANLRDTNLAEVNLNNANLKGVDFTHAKNIPSFADQLLRDWEDPKPPLSDAQLKSLVETFCGQRKDTPQGKIASFKLLKAIQSLPRLHRSYQPEKNKFNQDFEEILNETLLEVFERICEEFQAVESDYIHSLVNWINYKLRLYYKPKDRLREASRHKTLSLDRYIDRDENSTFLDLVGSYEDGETLNTIDGIIEQAQQHRRRRLGKQIWQYLENDPKHELRSCCSQKHSQCDCYLLVQKRLLSDPPISFQMIADELGIQLGTLTGHWAKKCKPLLVEIAYELEKNILEEKY